MELIIWTVLALLIAYIARERGQNYWLAGLVSFLLSPIVGFLLVIALPKRSLA